MNEIDLIDVHFQIADKMIIDDLSLRILKNQLTCIIGPNGSGKSTLLQLIAGLIQPTRGKIKIENTAITSLSKKSLAKKITFLPQQSRIPQTLTVYEYVALGRYCHKSWLGHLSKGDHIAIQHAIKLTNLSDLATHEAAKLSLGQQQRARIALTLAQASPYLLLDEPMTGLDLKQQCHLLNLLIELKKLGKTIIVILHDLHQVRSIADQVILMKAGKLKAIGHPAELLNINTICDVFDCNRNILENAFEVPVNL